MEIINEKCLSLIDLNLSYNPIEGTSKSKDGAIFIEHVQSFIENAKQLVHMDLSGMALENLADQLLVSI